MDSCCSQKKRKLEQEQDDDVDIISNLPDSILEKILSFLPTKYAFATSILSKRWKNVFPFGPPPIKLDRDESLLVNNCGNSYDQSNIFVSFVDKLFNSTLLNGPCVDIIKLRCINYSDNEKFISWVCAALRLKVQDLSLHLRFYKSEALFGSLNGCTTLTRLEFGNCFRVVVPNGFTLPNINQLVLFQLMFPWKDEDMFYRLISGCPMLEDLCFRKCSFRWEGSLHLRSSSLKKFTVKECRKTIELDVPKLEVLQYNDCITIQPSVKSLVLAHVDACLDIESMHEDELDGYADEIVDLVSAYSSAFHMYLDASTMLALQWSRGQLPIFQYLTSLALGCVSRSGGWALLAYLLLLSPNLEKLCFEEGFDKREGGYSRFESLLPNPPLCLELNLKKIEFLVFKEEEEELKLVEYFLRNGKVIQKLEIHCLPFKKKKTSRLFMLPKLDFQPR